VATGRKKKITADKNVCFEDALGKLEIIVNELEDGQLSLEEALLKFEEGISLSRHCMQRLQEIEAKIDFLLSDEQGQPAFRPAILGGDKEC
jgi:exodeoxyribonuclease VII small subunit